MIAADTSSISAYFKGDSGSDVQSVDSALANGLLRLPSVVFTELLSDPGASLTLASIITQFKPLEMTEGYWQRAGSIRQRFSSLGLRAKIADALIAQSCIDHNVPLITRDADLRHFAKHCGLKLA